MGGWPAGYLQSVEELNSGPPKTNPSSGREQDLNPGRPDYKSSALTTRPRCLPKTLLLRSIYTQVTHRSRWTHTKTCGAFWERVDPRTLREINLRAILYEWTFYREISSETCTCKHNRVFRRDREPSRIPEGTLKCLRRKGRKLKEFVYERIHLSIPKSSWLRRYVKVRRATKLRMFVSFIRRG